MERIVPPMWREDLLSRDRLLSRVARSVETYRVTTVCAPAGYGKTVLLADYARQTDRACIWLRIEESDRDPAELLRSLSQAVERDAATRRTVRETGPLGPHSWCAGSTLELANRIARRFEDTTIILDDLHLVSPSVAAMRAVRRLVTGTPDFVRFLVSSRHDIGRALHDLAPMDSAAPLDGAALRFTYDELEELLDRVGVSPEERPAAMERLDRCEGWPVAITLALRTQRHDETPATESDPDDARGAFAELVASLVARLDVADQQLLHELAHLERITPGLCLACLDADEPGQRLDRLASQDVLLERGPEGDSYTLHALFRDYLANESPNRRAFSRRQHRQAANWFHAHNEPVFELRHRIAAGDLRLAEQRLEGLAQQLAAEARWHTLIDLVRRLEATGPARLSPTLVRSVARAHVAFGNSSAAISRVTRALQADGLEADHVALLLVSRSFAHRARGDMDDALADAEHALRLSHGLAPNVRVDLCRLLGQAHASELRLALAGHWFRAASDLARRQESLGTRAMLALDLSRFEAMRGRFAAGVQHGRRAVRLADRSGSVVAHLFAVNNLAAVLLLAGEYSEASTLYEDALRETAVHGHRRIEAYMWIGVGDVRDALQLGVAAEECYRRAVAIARESDEADVLAQAHMALAASLRRAGRLEKSRALLDSQADGVGADRLSRLQWVIENAALSAAEGNHGLAEERLREVLAEVSGTGALVDEARARLHLANAVFASRGVIAAVPEVEALVKTLSDLGSKQFLLPACDLMPRMWGALQSVGRSDLHHAVTRPDLRPRVSPRLRGLPATAWFDDPHPSVLTPREREVVIALCEGMTRDEIGNRMGLSRSTIDKTISSLYASSGFRHAYQLVAWAHRCGLFDPANPPPPQTSDDSVQA